MYFFYALTVAALVSNSAVETQLPQDDIIVEENYIYVPAEEIGSNNTNSDIAICALPGFTPVAPDTTSFSDAYPMTYNGFYYAEEFSSNDTYDYVKYTATYTRNILLHVTTSNNCKIEVNVYNSTYGFSELYASYSANSDGPYYGYIPVRQGETIYFKVKCYQSCTWEGTLDLNFNPSGMCYTTHTNLHGYSLPHTGPAEIPYRWDNSVNELVSGQDFTFKDAFLEAMRIWETCGNITFVEDIWTKNYKLEVANIINVDVGVDVTLLGECYFSHCKIPRYEFYYDGISSIGLNPDGSPMTIWQAVVGVCLQALGLYLGLGTVSYQFYYYNVMFEDPRPYNFLGDGDIASLMYLWGDANEN